jgi:hypothetical protein
MDYGCFYVGLNPWKKTSLILYGEPNKNNTPYAIFKMYELETDHVFITHSSVTYLKNRTVEYDKAAYSLHYREENAIPGLSYSSDSSWVKVSLDCRNLNNPPSAWLCVIDAKKAGALVRQWDEIFTKYQTLLFQVDSLMAFYSNPSLDKRIYPKILKGEEYQPYDYSMQRIKTIGKWMQIYLFTPSCFGQSRESINAQIISSNPPAKVWIRYLDDNGRPTVEGLTE